MSIEQKINGDVGTLILGEEIDLDTSPTVRENIKDLLTSTKIVEVNLANVSYIDSSGIASLIEGMQMAKQQTGKEFHLVDVSNEVMKVIELAHLDKIFSIKSKTGTEASGSPAATEISEPEAPAASEYVDLDLNENQTTETPQEDTSPRVGRDDGEDDDKIKFKR
jgi:anti-sigma B factor antagonist